ncbi:hypothetical protein GH714_000311 [Hevea brasiliensis]|uniref:DUF4219 domain-containing protein n=1 Tax=Hevea brasiliensis TaxID=3981 RepID=A0A6A6N810_HEVBR|nr:hypothetical protein GH714_000311 [Hevea brasiliensis]
MSGFSSIAPPSFNGDNYPVWVVKMRSFLKAMNLWESVESDADPTPLGSDPTLAQIKKYEEDKAKKHKALTYLGLMKYFLGMEIYQCSTGIFISQRRYALDVLKKFKMDQSKSVATPLVQNVKLIRNDGEKKCVASVYRSLVGSLLYLTTTRPYLMFSASLLSRFMNTPSQSHLGAAKRVLRYLKGTTDYGIWFKKKEEAKLEGYSDSDWAGCVDDSKSTSGYVFSFGSGVFCWNSRKQEVVAQSTAEAEYISAAATTNQAIWLRKILKDLGQEQSSTNPSLETKKGNKGHPKHSVNMYAICNLEDICMSLAKPLTS